MRRKVVDATYVESTIPSRHSPGFQVDADVRLVSPNGLVDLVDAATGYTVIGAGKTSMDTCCWLLDQGVAPDRIRWIKGREPWLFDRAATQPLALLPSGFMRTYSYMVEAAAEAESPADLAYRLEAAGVFRRLDPTVDPEIFRGATLSPLEIESLRQVENVVRMGRVLRIDTDRVVLENGSLQSDPGQIYVDCTAAGANFPPARPIFEHHRITLQVVTFGIVPWSAALLGYAEARRDDDGEKNRLYDPSGYSGLAADFPRALLRGLGAQVARSAEPDLDAWNEGCRLNPMRAVKDHFDHPELQAAFTRLFTNMEPAMANLERIVGDRRTAPAAM